jgi:hypothetical protein
MCRRDCTSATTSHLFASTPDKLGEQLNAVTTRIAVSALAPWSHPAARKAAVAEREGERKAGETRRRRLFFISTTGTNAIQLQAIFVIRSPCACRVHRQVRPGHTGEVRHAASADQMVVMFLPPRTRYSRSCPPATRQTAFV